jgi:hypothetical protein
MPRCDTRIGCHESSWRIPLIITIFFSALNACAHAQTSSQACLTALPESLRIAVKQRFPKHRMLDLGDMSETSGDAKLYHEMFGDKCPGVASGDFDSNGQRDYGLYLVNKRTGQCILVASLAQQEKWIFEVLCESHECDLPGGTYLKTLEPGSYESMLADELTQKEISDGYVARINSKRPGVYFGGLETEGTAYFRVRKRWVKLEF